jgi:hypothetical protein
MGYCIEFINTTPATVQYAEELELEEGISQFEGDWVSAVEGEDIGGLMVYAEGDTVFAVYDYENMRGWIVEE